MLEDDSGSHSARVLIQEQVRVDAELTVVLMFEIPVKAEMLLPFDDGEGGVQRVEIGDLDIAVIVMFHLLACPRKTRGSEDGPASAPCWSSVVLSPLTVRGAIGLISAGPWMWFDGAGGAESGGRESSTWVFCAI